MFLVVMMVPLSPGSSWPQYLPISGARVSPSLMASQSNPQPRLVPDSSLNWVKVSLTTWAWNSE